MTLTKRVLQLEKAYSESHEPSSMAQFWWDMHREDNPEFPERPPDDWIAYYHGKTLEDLISEPVLTFFDVVDETK